MTKTVKCHIRQSFPYSVALFIVNGSPADIAFYCFLIERGFPLFLIGKMIQTDEFEFEELVRTSTLLCFSSSKAPGSEQTLKGRKRIPLTDPEVNVTYHLISSAKSTILQSVSPTFEFRPQK